MASQAQIDANRRNAQSSTGPRTQEGKAVVAFNALKHGLRADIFKQPMTDPENFGYRLVKRLKLPLWIGSTSRRPVPMSPWSCWWP